ncbi:MAG: HicB family protein [Alteromonadaceae bacterium]|nr:MAG: HicB family protein [Alteromonadaceae bacterium]
MIYPAYVHLGDKVHAHGVTLPDFEGCFTAADEYTNIPHNVQEAVELHFEGESFKIPEPSDISELENNSEYTDGIWMLIDIDISKFDSQPMRLNVSLPTYIVKKMDDYASQNHLSRSALTVKATEKYLDSDNA